MLCYIQLPVSFFLLYSLFWSYALPDPSPAPCGQCLPSPFLPISLPPYPHPAPATPVPPGPTTPLALTFPLGIYKGDIDRPQPVLALLLLLFPYLVILQADFIKSAKNSPLFFHRSHKIPKSLCLYHPNV